VREVSEMVVYNRVAQAGPLMLWGNILKRGYKREGTTKIWMFLKNFCEMWVYDRGTAKRLMLCGTFLKWWYKIAWNRWKVNVLCEIWCNVCIWYRGTPECLIMWGNFFEVGYKIERDSWMLIVVREHWKNGDSWTVDIVRDLGKYVGIR
jgi:hypothetical protein